MRTKPKQRRPSSRTSSQSSAAKQDGPAQAKLFWTGRSQAVRLPKEFRFEGETVLIRREGDKVILEPDKGWPPGYIEWLLSGPGVHIEPPSREGPARTRDAFQVPLDDGSGRTMNVFELLEQRARNRKRSARKRKRRAR